MCDAIDSSVMIDAHCECVNKVLEERLQRDDDGEDGFVTGKRR